jgi:hypothetical protein
MSTAAIRKLAEPAAIRFSTSISTMPRTRSLLVALASAALAVAQECPALSPEPNWPMSKILQYVCARDPHGIDCSQIPELLDGLIEVQESDAEKKQFVLAKDAAEFMCDPCLAPIRQGVIFLEDPPSADKKKPNPTITDANAQLSTCRSTCLPKFKTISTEFGGPAKVAYEKLEVACSSGSVTAIGSSTRDLMHALFSSLKEVRKLAADGMFAVAEPAAKPLFAAAPFARSQAIRSAAFGCLVVGATLLFAAALVARRPTVALEAKRAADHELL